MVGAELTISIVAHAVRNAMRKGVFIALPSRKGTLRHQVLMSMSEIEQIELAGIVFCGAKGKTELVAKRRVLIIDLTCHGKVGFNEDCPPEGDGDSAEQNRQSHDKRNQRAGPTRTSSDNRPDFHFALPHAWRYYQAPRAFCAQSGQHATFISSGIRLCPSAALSALSETIDSCAIRSNATAAGCNNAANQAVPAVVDHCLRTSSDERHQNRPYSDQTKRHPGSGDISAHRPSPALRRMASRALPH